MVRVITDEKIKDCSQCPLKTVMTRDCGKIKTVTRGHAKQVIKKPDDRCKIINVEENKND